MTIPPSPVGPSSTPSSPENRGTTTTTTTTVESETKHAAQPQLPRPRQRVPLGYTKLAGFMVKRDQEMFRRFRRMAVRDILYLQAELCDLEHQFDRRALGDANGGDPEVYFDREWWHLKESGGHQWKLALQIREKVAEYYEAIHRYSEIDRLTYPAEQHRKLVFDWIHGASLGGQCEFLGRDLANHPYKSVFHQDHVDDLIFLGNVVEENDAFSRFLLDRGLRWFHWGWRHVKASKLVFFAAAASAAICDIDTTAAAIKPVNRNEEDGYRHEDSDSKTALWHYEESSLRSAVRVIGMGLSPMPPLCGIITLFFVENLRARVFIVCGFTLMFSLCLAAVTRARRIEVFAATAAWGDTRFASVMVVFVGQIDDPNEEWKQWVEEIRDSVKAMGG